MVSRTPSSGSTVSQSSTCMALPRYRAATSHVPVRRAGPDPDPGARREVSSEAGNDGGREQLQAPARQPRRHAGPAHAEVNLTDPQTRVPAQFLRAVRRRAHDEAISGEFG